MDSSSGAGCHPGEVEGFHKCQMVDPLHFFEELSLRILSTQEISIINIRYILVYFLIGSSRKKHHTQRDLGEKLKSLTSQGLDAATLSP